VNFTAKTRKKGKRLKSTKQNAQLEGHQDPATTAIERRLAALESATTELEQGADQVVQSNNALKQSSIKLLQTVTHVSASQTSVIQAYWYSLHLLLANSFN